MKFHPLALAALLASEADAFFAPNPFMITAARREKKKTMIILAADSNANFDAASDDAITKRREQVLKEMEQAEARRRELEAEAQKSLDQARALQNQAAASGFNGGPAVPIAAATLGALVAGRSSLQNRQKKIEEEQARLDRERDRLEREAEKSQNGFGVSSVNCHSGQSA